MKYLKQENRLKLIKAVLRGSLLNESYDITLVTIIKFQKELNDVEIIPFLYILETKLESEYSKYEIKLQLLQQAIPLIKKQQAQRIVLILKNTLDLKPSESIFLKNINPLRLGLIFYSVIEDFKRKFNSLAYSCLEMR